MRTDGLLNRIFDEKRKGKAKEAERQQASMDPEAYERAVKGLKQQIDAAERLFDLRIEWLDDDMDPAKYALWKLDELCDAISEAEPEPVTVTTCEVPREALDSMVDFVRKKAIPPEDGVYTFELRGDPDKPPTEEIEVMVGEASLLDEAAARFHGPDADQTITSIMNQIFGGSLWPAEDESDDQG